MEALTVQAIVVGIALGFMYGLVGLSFTVIYNSSKIMVFALGDYFMLGGLLTAYFVTDYQMWLAPSLLIIIVALVALSVLVYKILIAPIVKRSLQIGMLSTLAISLLIANITGLITHNYPKNVEPFINMGAINIMGARIQAQYLLLILVAIAFIVIYWYFLHRTRWGIAFRATGLDSEAGKIVGIRVGAMIIMAFAMSGAIAAIGGAMYSPVSTPISTMGTAFSINGFIAAVLGGLAHPFGAIIGGLILGVVQQLLTVYIASELAFIIDISTFLILMIILIWRPQGILPERE